MANKALKSIKPFLRWCVGRAVLDRSPADGVPLPAKQITRDRVLSDDELGRTILAARQLGGPYGNTVEMLALTGQRREEVSRCTWDEIDLNTRIWRLPSEHLFVVRQFETDQAFRQISHGDASRHHH